MKKNSLWICVMMDLVGYLSFSVPVIGEFTDLIWAPISALVFFKMFGGKKGFIGAIFNFVEEALPGFDFIPSFSLMWILQRFLSHKNENPTLKATIS